jgi:hypothetical protein
VAGAARARLPERSDTPAWIRVLATVAVIATLATALLTAANARTVRSGIELVGQHTAPHVTATEDLSFALADMDAQVANVLLAGGDPALESTRGYARKTYEHRRIQADADLQQATAIAGSDESVQRVIRDILDRLGQYEAAVATILAMNDTEHNPAGRPSVRLLVQYRQASGVMGGILESTSRLTQDNTAVVDGSYRSTVRSAGYAGVGLVLLGLVTLGALIGLQVLLRLTMRRRLNPALLAATVLAGALIVGGLGTGSAATDRLTLAEQHAFHSLLRLEQARALGYDSNADASRWLLDPANAKEYEQAFLRKSQQVADVRVQAIGDYDAAYARALDAYRNDHADIEFGGLLGDTLRHIEFPGERITADTVLRAWRDYQRDDRTMHTMAATSLPDAISFATSGDPGNSDGDFADYDTKLGILIGIDQHAFDTAISDGSGTLSGWTGWLPYTAVVVIAALVLLGVRPRLAEYR